MIEAKPSERPPVIRYVVRNAEGFYYDGHGQAPTLVGKEYFEGVGEFGVPGFNTRNILFAIKYGDVESVEALIRNHKVWCIQNKREDLFGLFETCDVLETYT